MEQHAKRYAVQMAVYRAAFSRSLLSRNKTESLNAKHRPLIMTEPAIELSEIEFDATDEDQEIGVAEENRKVYTDQADPEIESLYGKYQRGKLIVQPEFQRLFVWDVAKASRLIESALLDIPLPVVYLSEESDGTESVIDGQQRLTSFFAFLDGRFPDGKEFRLSSLKVFPEFTKKLYRDLPDQVQDKIRYCKMRTVTFRRESDSELKFEVFERLNTGAVSLNDQELRNCIYRGPYNDLLRDLAGDRGFRALLGLKKTEKRMRDVELVLRFAAFYHATYLKYRPPMRRFLNDEMKEHQHITDDNASVLRDAFKRAVSVAKSLFGEHAFKRFYKGTEKNPNGRWELKKFNASLYDVLMYSFAHEEKNTVFQHLDSVREALLYLMTEDQEFIDAIELSTSSVQAVTKRFNKWRMALQHVLGVASKEPRLFSLALKEELYERDPACKLCGQRVQTLDDAAVDHIEQYWTGGRTIPENARITHRYCNTARPRHDS